jgi:hypothetical protein
MASKQWRFQVYGLDRGRAEATVDAAFPPNPLMDVLE